MKTLKEIINANEASKLMVWSKTEDGRVESIGFLSELIFEGDDLSLVFEEKTEYHEDSFTPHTEFSVFENNDYKICQVK